MSVWVWQTNNYIGSILKSTFLQVECIGRSHDGCAIFQHFSAGQIPFFFYGSQRTFVCEPKQRQDPLNLAYSSFQYVSGFLFLYYSSSLYLGQLNRVRLNLWTYIVVFAAGMHASYNVATLFAFSSVNWQFIDMNRNIFRIPSPQVSHDDQFKFSWTWNSMLNYVRYMQCSCRREKIQLCICDRDKKQLKTKRTWNGVSGTHTTFALSTQWILQMQCNFFSLVPVLIIKKFPFIGFTSLGTRDQIKLISFEKVCIFSERKFLFANFTSRIARSRHIRSDVHVINNRRLKPRYLWATYDNDVCRHQIRHGLPSMIISWNSKFNAIRFKESSRHPTSCRQLNSHRPFSFRFDVHLF